MQFQIFHPAKKCKSPFLLLHGVNPSKAHLKKNIFSVPDSSMFYSDFHKKKTIEAQ